MTPSLWGRECGDAMSVMWCYNELCGVVWFIGLYILHTYIPLDFLRILTPS